MFVSISKTIITINSIIVPGLLNRCEHFYNGHCYVLLTNPAVYPEGRQACRDMGMDAAIIKDADEQRFISNMLL